MIETELLTPQILKAVINRPGALNAINFEVMDHLERLIERVQKDDNIRVLMLTGAGSRSFVSGGDLREFHTITSKEKAAEMSHRMQDILNRLEQLPCWTVAFVNGDAYGGGIELMLAFDFRIAAKGIKLGFTQGRFNLTPGWGGLTRLVEKTGRANALKWLGRREILPAEQALQEGILDELLSEENPESAALDWVQKLTKNDRQYIRALKRGASQLHPEREEAMRNEIEAFSELWISDEHTGRVARFFENKK